MNKTKSITASLADAKSRRTKHLNQISKKQKQELDVLTKEAKLKEENYKKLVKKLIDKIPELIENYDGKNKMIRISSDDLYGIKVPNGSIDDIWQMLDKQVVDYCNKHEIPLTVETDEWDDYDMDGGIHTPVYHRIEHYLAIKIE